MAVEKDTNKDSSGDQKDQLGLLILKKGIRISGATYKLTDYFDPDEPARHYMRESASKLVVSVVSYTGSLPVEPSLLIKDITDSINSLMSFIDVLNMADIVSRTNFEIMRAELLSLKELVENYFHDRYGHALTLDDFMKKIDVPVLPEKVSFNGQLAALSEIRSNGVTRGSDRQVKIFEYIKSKGSSSIRDLVLIIKGCSEKTIQRELQALIEAGLIKREGERRWSRYVSII